MKNFVIWFSHTVTLILFQVTDLSYETDDNYQPNLPDSGQGETILLSKIALSFEQFLQSYPFGLFLNILENVDCMNLRRFLG